MEAQKNESHELLEPREAPSQGGAPREREQLEEKPAAKEARTGTGLKAEPRGKTQKNDLRKLRTERMLSKAELARRAQVSTLTIDRVERGMPCRMDTKRKILEALGLTPDDRAMVFGDDDD